MDIKDIQNLIKFVAKSGANEVKLEMEDVKITIKTGKGDKQTIVQALPCLLYTSPSPRDIGPSRMPSSA